LNRLTSTSPSVGRRVLGTALALMLALLQPWAVTFQLMMPMAGVSLFVIAEAALYSWGGLVPAVVLGAGGCIMTAMALGPANAGMLLMMTVLPAAMILYGLHKRADFFVQVRNAVITALAGTAIAAVLAGIVYGQNMISGFLSIMREFFEVNREQLLEQVRMMTGLGEQVTMELF